MTEWALPIHAVQNLVLVVVAMNIFNSHDSRLFTREYLWEFGGGPSTEGPGTLATRAAGPPTGVRTVCTAPALLEDATLEARDHPEEGFKLADCFKSVAVSKDELLA